MGHGGGQVNVPHAFPPDFANGDFGATLFTNDPFVFHAFVLAAQTFIIFNRAENTGTEQTLFFGLVGSIINRLGFFDLTERPRPNLLWAGNGDADLIEGLGVFCGGLGGKRSKIAHANILFRQCVFRATEQGLKDQQPFPVSAPKTKFIKG